MISQGVHYYCRRALLHHNQYSSIKVMNGPFPQPSEIKTNSQDPPIQIRQCRFGSAKRKESCQVGGILPHSSSTAGGFPVRWVIYFVSYPQSTQTKAFFFKMRSEGRVFTGVFWRILQIILTKFKRVIQWLFQSIEVTYTQYNLIGVRIMSYLPRQGDLCWTEVPPLTLISTDEPMHHCSF